MLSYSNAAAGRTGNERRTGRGVDAVTVSVNAPPSGASVPISKAAERPSGLSAIWRNATRRRNADTGSSIARNNSPGASALYCGPDTKSIAATRRSVPSGRQTEEAVELVVNARVAVDPDVLRAEVALALDYAGRARGAAVELRQVHSLRPGRPVPTHRYALAVP